MSAAPDPPPAGTLWQAGRWMPALDPDFYRLDDRSTADLAHWAVGFAGLLTYFDAQNAAVPAQKGQPAPWAAFFHNDVSFLLARISVHDPQRAYSEGLNNPGTIEKAIQTYVSLLADWTRRAEELAVVAPEGSIEAALYGTLKRASENELARTLPECERPGLERSHKAALPDVWFDRRVHYSDRRTLFSLLNRVMGQIVDRARGYLDASLSQKHDHPAQTGLFLAFLHLLRRNQADLNTLTERHLRFYYETVLRLHPRPAQPDRAHVAFDLAPDSADVILPRGTRLVAGSAAVPDPTIFLTDEQVTLNRITIGAVRSVQVVRSGGKPARVTAIRAFPDAASADGFGLPFPPGEAGWPPFGPQTEADRANARLGVAFEAEILALSEGTRRITLTLTFDAGHDWTLTRAIQGFRDQVADFFHGKGKAKVRPTLVRNYLARAWDMVLQGEAGTTPLTGVTADLSQVAENRLILTGVLSSEVPAIAAAAGHAAPLLSLTLNPDAPIYGYDTFVGAVIAAARIDVAVDGLRTLGLAGPFGPIDPTKPFPPFGDIPLPGDAFYLDAPELTQDALTDLELTLDWTDLPVPPDSFAKHYKDYGLDLSAQSFTVAISRSDGTAWHPLQSQGASDPAAGAVLPMFALLPLPENGVSPRSVYAVQRVPPSPQAPPPAIGAAQRPGALRVVLVSPPEGFGQAMYPALVTRIALNNAQKAERSPWRFWASGDKLAEPPPPPLLPQVAGISASYRAHATSDLPRQGAAPIRLYQINPLGGPTISPDGRMIGVSYDYDGMLQIGLRQANPPETLTLLFDIDDLVARSWTKADVMISPTLGWHYFNGRRWVPLDPDAVQMDQTDGLVTRGIVRLALPADLQPSPQYPGGLTWIALTLAGDVQRYGTVRQILPQAVAATRRIDPDAPPKGIPSEPAGAIQRLADPLPQIKAVLQPYATQGGRAAEDRRGFQQRVSERLSHKRRAIVARDYTRLVLEAFPQIAQVTCLNLAPGRVEVIVTPRRDPPGPDTAALIPQRVPLHVRIAIAEFLQGLNGAGAALPLVRNPAYEPLRVTAQIAPAPTATSALLHQIEAAVHRLIAPWLFDPDAPLPIGQARLDPSTLRARIEQIPDVALIASLSVVQIYRQTGTGNERLYGLKDTARSATLHGRRSLLRGASPWSVFVPDAAHGITFLGPRHGIGTLRVGRDLYLTPPSDIAAFTAHPARIPTLPAPLGIGGMTIGQDFIPTDPEDVIAPPDAAITPYPLPETPLPAPSELD
ncbi:baseplate J/gp47 family protein [Thalassococcus sp. BH17M4-6]|uniref:baseplate J/gp47 family protein n=1 Tax=Thalassococcus sp. BH17M4-6 TaxID=3413148 RepID=UPI003BC83D7F